MTELSCFACGENLWEDTAEPGVAAGPRRVYLNLRFDLAWCHFAAPCPRCKGANVLSISLPPEKPEDFRLTSYSDNEGRSWYLPKGERLEGEGHAWPPAEAHGTAEKRERPADEVPDRPQEQEKRGNGKRKRPTASK